MREFFTIAIFKIKADIRMNKTTLNSQKEKHSTLSLRRATRYAVNQFPVTLISIHALLAESDRMVKQCQALDISISIHALLAESDVWPGLLARPFFLISIHALLAESDSSDR